MTDVSTLLMTVLLGGVLGLFGQGLRAVAGLRKGSSEAAQEEVTFAEWFDGKRFVVSLMIGFLVGVGAALALGPARLAFEPGNVPLLLGLVAAGYAGSDFIEAFIGKFTPQHKARPFGPVVAAQAPSSTREGLPLPPMSRQQVDEILKNTDLLRDVLTRVQKANVGASAPPPGAPALPPLESFPAPSAPTDWAQWAAPVGAPPPIPAAPPAPQTVDLLYATNRGPAFDDSYFSGERNDALSYGTATVQVPLAHRVGKLELPFKLTLLSFTIYEQAADPAVHFIINNVDVRSLDDWKELVAGSGKDHALVFVHGFNTTFRDAVYRAAQIMWDLQYGGIPVLFSWPSRGAVMDYVYDRDSAMFSRAALIEVLRNLRNAGAKRIDILAHSMGNLVTLDALANHPHTTDPLGIAEILMAAPDVDRDQFRQIAARVRAAVPGMTLYASSADRALAASKRLAGNIPRAGDVPPGGPIVVPGIESIDVTAIGAELFGLGHGPFASTRSILNDIGLIIRQSLRPPNARLNDIRGMPDGAVPPSWWRWVR